MRKLQYYFVTVINDFLTIHVYISNLYYKLYVISHFELKISVVVSSTDKIKIEPVSNDGIITVCIKENKIII